MENSLKGRTVHLDIAFVKYHGCGNDFIIVDELQEEEIPEIYRGELASLLCNRRYGVGADDILYLTSSKKADSMMRIFEPDGSEAEMSGNGARCAAAYLCEKLCKKEVLIDTKSGAKHVKKVGNQYTVNMGKLETTNFEVGKFLHVASPPNVENLLKRNFVSKGICTQAEVSIVIIGEPHVVVFVDDVGSESIFCYAKGIAKNRKLFPFGTNVDFVQIVNQSTIKLRTYERGVWDETMACGTGATAAAVASYIKGKIKNTKIKAITKGGTLIVRIRGGSLFLTGPATKVYNGLISVELQ